MTQRYIGMGGMVRKMMEAQLFECENQGYSIIVIDPANEYEAMKVSADSGLLLRTEKPHDVHAKK